MSSSASSNPPEPPEGDDPPQLQRQQGAGSQEMTTTMNGTTEGNPKIPPGDLFLTKTPPNIQWLRTSNNHELDEKASNPSAFKRLTQALERHKSGSVHHYPPHGPAPVHQVNAPDGKRERVSRFDVSDPMKPIYNRRFSLDEAEGQRQVPGYYIEPSEHAGLPGTSDPEKQARKEAERLVRSITTRRPFSGMRSRKAGKGKSKLEKSLSQGRWSGGALPESKASSDVERDAESEGAEAGGEGTSRGVLSTLLTLYGHADGLPDSGLPTPLYSPREREGINHDDDHHRDRKQPAHQRQISTDSIEEVKEAEQEAETPLPTTKPSAYISPGDRDGRPRSRMRLKSYLSNMMHRRRMPMTRNSAGVLGPLVAATGTLTVVASPAQSQLQPDLKSPGYRLSRYSLDEKTERVRSRSAADGSRTTPPSIPSTPPSPTLSEPAARRVRGTGVLSNIPSLTSLRSGTITPTWTSAPTQVGDSYVEPQFRGQKGQGGEEYSEYQMEEEKKRERKRKRKKAQVFITRHVAKIIERQEFIMKFCRAMMMFGGPSHRLQSQIMSTAKVLDIDCNCIYLPDVLILSFDDNSTSTSSVKFIRQGSSLDLQKLDDAYGLYRKVIYDKLSVSDASTELDQLMRRPQFYSWWQIIIMGGLCSSAICTVSFGGSFLDAAIVFPLGALLVAIQILSTRNELYSNVFEVTITTLFSFLAAALASTRKFCYSAVASSSIVLILPGFLVLCGSLEIMSRNIVAGSVRLCYAVVYALFLGFGLAIGAEVFQEITGTRVVGSEDYACVISHPVDGPWYRRTPSLWWAFLTVPIFSLLLSMISQAPYNRKELILLVVISCAGWTTNHFVGLRFVGQSDIIAAVGAFAVGLISNLYARFFGGNAFVIMITGILFQVPSGLGAGGLLTYASQQTGGSPSSYLYGFQTALKLISVAIGLTVGLGISLVIMHPIQSKRRSGGIFSL